MKPFKETDLIAYHLQELSPRRARALEAAMRLDPSLASESEAYATMLSSFKAGTHLDVTEAMMDRNWARLSSRLPSSLLRPPLLSRWFVPALAGLAFAVTAVFMSTFQTHHPAHVSPPLSSLDEVAQIPPPQTSLQRQSTNGTNYGHRPPHAYVVPSSPTPLAASPFSRSHDVPIGNPASVPSGEEPAPMLQYIPLARAPLFLPPKHSAPALVGGTTPQPATPAANNGEKIRQKQNIIRRDHFMEVTLAMGGTLIGTRDFTSDGAAHSQGATHAISAIGSLHQQFRPTVGYRFTASYARPDFQYFYRPNNTSSGLQTDINGRLYEFAGTYVVQGPHRGIVTTTMEGGAGLMAFLPTPDRFGTTGGSNLRAAGIVGANAEFHVTKHLAVHTSYRVQIFKGPDFLSSGSSAPQLPTMLISNEPAVGISYRFLQK